MARECSTPFHASGCPKLALSATLSGRWIKTYAGSDGTTIDGEEKHTIYFSTGQNLDKFIDWHSYNRVTVEVADEVLTGKTKSYEAVAAHMTQTVKGNNLENMLVSFLGPSFSPSSAHTLHIPGYIPSETTNVCACVGVYTCVCVCMESVRG